MIIDRLYAANLEELLSVLNQLSDAAKKRHDAVGGVGRYHPSMVQLSSMQATVVLEAETLTDGSEVYDLKFYWDGAELPPRG